MLDKIVASTAACAGSPSWLTSFVDYSQQVAPILLCCVIAALVWGGVPRRAGSSTGKTADIFGQYGIDEEAAAERSPLLTELADAAPTVDRCGLTDSIRFWLVTAVIVGHAIALPTIMMPQSSYIFGPALVWMSTFHMPGLALLSGACSRSPLTKARFARLVARVLAPWLFYKAFTFIITCREDFAKAGGFEEMRCLTYFPQMAETDAAFDSGAEWYLFSLFVWRLAAAMLNRLQPTLMLTVALAVGIFSGYYGNAFSVNFNGNILGTQIPVALAISQRTMSFFPFFALGLLVDPGAMRSAVRHWPHAPTVARLCLIGALVACYAAANTAGGSPLAPFELGAVGDFNSNYIAVRKDPEHPWMAITPPACGWEHATMGLQRAWRYMLCTLAVALVFVAAPSGPGWVSEAGRHTMYPYILHQVPVAYMCAFVDTAPGWPMWVTGKEGHYGWAFWVGVAATACCLTYISTLAPVRWVFGPLIEPDWVVCRWDLQLEKKAPGQKMQSSSTQRDVPVVPQCSKTGAPIVTGKACV